MAEFDRYATYSSLMRDRQHWQRMLAVISCKSLREDREKRDEFNKMINLLLSPSFRQLVKKRDWHLVFTGGTFASIPSGVKVCPEYDGRLHALAPSALGVIQVANLVVYGHVYGVAFFNHPEDLYADSPQNLCLRRICNACDTPLVEDISTIEYILDIWKDGHIETIKRQSKYPRRQVEAYYGAQTFKDNILVGTDLVNRLSRKRSQETLAIVTHDEEKTTMLQFCVEHIDKILSYHRIISTGTTGTLLREQLEVALQALGKGVSSASLSKWGWDPKKQKPKSFLWKKIQPLLSGPKGGDVQISAKVIDGTCHRVLFFQDPGSAHPHQFDIRLMEKAVQDPVTAALFATSRRTARLIV